MNAEIEREYKRERARQLRYAPLFRSEGGDQGRSLSALRAARLEVHLKDAEAAERVRFRWEIDPDGFSSAMDQDFQTARDETSYRKALESGEIEVWCCSAEVPKECPHCGQPLEDEWRQADGMSSLCGIDVRDDDDGRDYRREIEREMALEAGVIS